MIKDEEFEDTYLLSTENGENYIIKKFKLYKQKINLNSMKIIINEIKYIESLNNNYINKVLHYFIEKDDNYNEEFCILYYNNKYAKKIINDSKELKKNLFQKILFKLIFGIQSLQPKIINLSLSNLNCNYVFFDNDYNIKFDIISKFINEFIFKKPNILEKKMIFFLY